MLTNMKYFLLVGFFLFCKSPTLSGQEDSTFADDRFFYSITIPGDWSFDPIEDKNSPIRLIVTAPDEKRSLTIMALKTEKGNVSLDKLSNILESSEEMKKFLGELVLSTRINRYGNEVIEKHYKRTGFYNSLYSTAEYMAKDNYGFIFIYSSESQDSEWQQTIRQSTIFSFPEPTRNKVFRFAILGIALIVLYNCIGGSSEPFSGKKSFRSGLGSIFELIKFNSEKRRLYRENNNLSEQLNKTSDELKRIEKKVNKDFNSYWDGLKNHFEISN